VIVAIEGTSAAGKTTWCRTHAPLHHVTEDGPSRERWARALALERREGLAVCDTDPAKLYYDYALWRTGRLDGAGWARSCAVVRAAFDATELGLPDAIFVAVRDVETLRRYRDGDPTRRRHRFELHVELAPRFAEWWAAVDAVEPGRVRWRHPRDLAELRACAPRARRTGADLLDDVLACLTAAQPRSRA